MIRLACAADAAALLDIYAPYVTNTAVTFEYEPPSEAEFRRRVTDTLKLFPYLVFEEDGAVLGYAYASRFKARAAYDWAVETTVYVRQGSEGRGIGRALYTRLEELLARQNVTNLNACITFPNPPSVAFHESMGYKAAARFTMCGYKLGRWWDMIWMEKFIAEHKSPPDPFVPFPDLCAAPNEK